MNEAPWDELIGRLAGHSLWDVVVGACYLAVPVFVAADLWSQHRRSPGTGARAHEVRTAAAMAVGALVIGVAYSAAFVLAFGLVAQAAPFPGLGDHHPIIGFALAFVAWDLIGWLYHRIGHTSAIGWASHRAHHTGRTFDGSLALRQSWFPLHGLAVQPLIALTGIDLTVIVVCIAVSNLAQALQHSASVRQVPRWVAAVVVTPEAHRHHHLTGAGPVNLGPVFTVWDRLAGTWVPGPVPEGASYGERGPGDGGVLVAVGSGWVELLRRPATDSSPPSRGDARLPGRCVTVRQPDLSRSDTAVQSAFLDASGARVVHLTRTRPADHSAAVGTGSQTQGNVRHDHGPTWS